MSERYDNPHLGLPHRRVTDLEITMYRADGTVDRILASDAQGIDMGSRYVTEPAPALTGLRIAFGRTTDVIVEENVGKTADKDQLPRSV